jgi:DNA mismatch repair protein MutS
LVILDEIGRGTSTLDGLSLAWAVAEHLAARGPRCLFATHYHELTELAEQHDEIRNLNVTVREWQDQVVFLHRIVPGAADRSYGIHVARIAGLPSDIVKRADELLNQLAVNHINESPSTASPETTDHRSAQMSLFTEYVHHPLLDEVANLDLNTLSPLDAFEQVRQWQAQLNDNNASSEESDHT